MTTLNVPNISRKKPVACNVGYNSFRIFGEEAQARGVYQRPADLPPSSIETYDKTLQLPSWYYNSHYEPERNIRDRNRCQVTYLRRNVRTLNDPVCYVPSEQEGDHWWPARVPPLGKPTPPVSKDSTMRADYDWTNEHRAHEGSRHKHNTTRPALGSVPVNSLPEKDGRQRFYKEKISYEHQYDSRWTDNYPIRSTRHGAYVSQPISAEKATRLLQDPEKWTANTLVKDPQPPSQSHASTVPSGILPGLSDSVTYRKMDQANHKRRDCFDIAPRSNFNVRIREYIPSMISSAPQTSQLQQTACQPSNHIPAPASDQPMAMPESSGKIDAEAS